MIIPLQLKPLADEARKRKYKNAVQFRCAFSNAQTILSLGKRYKMHEEQHRIIKEMLPYRKILQEFCVGLEDFYQKVKAS